MKSKNFSKRTIMFTILPILLILTMILNMAYFSLKNSISVDASANNNENYEAATCTMEAEGNIYVKPKLENDFVKANSNFTISFETNLENYKVSSYETEGINIISQSVNKNIITFTVFYNGESEKVKLTIYIEDENENNVSTSVFGVQVEKGLLLNAVSFENALSQYYHYQFENGEISDEAYQEKLNLIYHCVGEAEIKYNEVVYPSRVDDEIVLYGPSKTVSGNLKWKDDFGTTHPLQYNKVCLYDTIGNEIIKTTSTDESGAYRFYLPMTRIQYVRVYVYAAGDDVEVMSADESAYFYMSETLDLVANDEVVLNWSADMTSVTGQAIQIAQAAIFASKYYCEMFNIYYPTAVEIIYPYLDSDGCFYQSGKIHITDPNLKNGDFRSYNSWDVIMHEYGHHVQRMENYNFSASVGGSHNFVYALKDNKDANGNAYGKDKGSKLAWSESIATLFSGMAQNYYSSQLYGIKGVADNEYSSYNGAHLNYETSQTTNNGPILKSGETCEATIIGVLWDIQDALDSTSTPESHDKLCVPDSWFYTLLSNSKAKTLYQFINYFLVERDVFENNDLGVLLEYYNLAPQNLVFNNCTFSWSSSSDTYSYNSKFQVRIYDENNKEIYASSYTTGKSLTITEGQLYHFLANGTCYARVFGYDSTSPESCFFSNAIVPYLNRGDIVGSKLVRSSEYRINDEGFMVNSYDRIDIQSITGFTYTQLKNLGYKNLKIEISINVREINDGYQHIAIFDSSFENAKELASTKFEHGRLKKDTSTKTYNFTYNISLDDIPSSLFYIRYDGSGAFEDDWVNSNLNVKLTVSQ